MVRNSVSRLIEDRKGWSVLCQSIVDEYFFVCGESELILRRLVEGFGKVGKRRSLKVNAEMSKVAVVGEESLQYEIMLDGEHLEHISDIINLGYMLDEKETNDV